MRNTLCRNHLTIGRLKKQMLFNIPIIDSLPNSDIPVDKLAQISVLTELAHKNVPTKPPTNKWGDDDQQNTSGQTKCMRMRAHNKTNQPNQTQPTGTRKKIRPTFHNHRTTNHASWEHTHGDNTHIQMHSHTHTHAPSLSNTRWSPNIVPFPREARAHCNSHRSLACKLCCVGAVVHTHWRGR